MIGRLTLAALLIAGLVATAGIAVAAVAGPEAPSTVDATLESGDDTVSTTATIPDDDEDDDSTSTTTSTIPDDHGDDDSTSTTTSTIPDDHGDDDSTSTTTSTMSIEDGVHVIDASPAGSVTIEIVDGALRLVSIDIDGVWTETERNERWDRIELEFERADAELEIEAKIEYGELRIEVSFEDAD